MSSRLIAVAFAFISLFSFYAPEALAERVHLAPSIGVHIGAEYYSWEEFDQSGSRLLRESGPREMLAFSFGNLNRRTSGLVFRWKGRGYYGDVSYNGQTQPAPSVPVRSDTEYWGGQTELTGGYRFKNVFSTYSLDLLASGGVNGWRRTIANARTSTGTFVNGSTEDYRVFYFKAGAGLFHVRGHWLDYVQAGMKRPIDTREDAHLNGFASSIIVKPRSQMSFYFSWEIDHLDRQQERTYGIMVYYDSLRFAQSPSVQFGGSVAYQPQSHQDTFGVQLGYYFNPF